MCVFNVVFDISPPLPLRTRVHLIYIKLWTLHHNQYSQPPSGISLTESTFKWHKTDKNSQPKSGNHTPVPFVPSVPSVPRVPRVPTNSSDLTDPRKYFLRKQALWHHRCNFVRLLKRLTPKLCIMHYDYALCITKTSTDSTDSSDSMFQIFLRKQALWHHRCTFVR